MPLLIYIPTFLFLYDLQTLIFFFSLQRINSLRSNMMMKSVASARPFSFDFSTLSFQTCFSMSSVFSWINHVYEQNMLLEKFKQYIYNGISY